MKKHILFLFILAACGLVVTSCAKTGTDENSALLDNLLDGG